MLANSPKLVAHRDLLKPTIFAPDSLRADFAHSFAPNPTQPTLTPPSTNPYLLALYHCGESTF